MPTTVSALPVRLLDFARRTAPTDRAARLAATGLDSALARLGRPGLGAAVDAHVARARLVAERTSATGAAVAIAGGSAGVLALTVRSPTVAMAALLVGATVRSSTPDGIRMLAASLDTATVHALAASHPHLVGPVDGMPLAARYEANRRLAQSAALDAADRGDHRRAAALRALAAPERQLLLLDVRRGHVAEVLGDVATADAVSVVVPGMGNRLDEFATVRAKAAALRSAAAAIDSDLATVAWLGYDSPVVDVVLDDAAVAGGAALARAVDGLSVPVGTPVTVVGHSYGSVVAGAALRAGLEIDAVAVTGSPGVLAGSASDLGPAPVYALRAPGDFISWTEHFGPDPTSPDFGATRLATGESRGHSGYFEVGSVALANLALVAAGRGVEATVVRPDVAERAIDGADDVHERLVEAPVDAVQDALADAAGAVSTVTDGVEARVPDLLAGPIDRLQAQAGVVMELGHRVIDDAQRLTSPDLYGDLAGDAWDTVFG